MKKERREREEKRETAGKERKEGGGLAKIDKEWCRWRSGHMGRRDEVH